MLVIACRSLIRIDLAWKFAHTFVVQKPNPFLQSTCSLFHGFNNKYWKINSLSDMKSVANRKMPRTVTTSIWRLVSTEENWSIECLVNDQISAHDEAGEANELCSSESSSTVSKKYDEGNSLGRRSTPSEEKHRMRINVAASLIRFIEGKESLKWQKIEKDFAVDIIFPSAKKEDYIIIEGVSPECVTTASEELLALIKEAIKSPTLDYSHFISLPLAIHPQLVEKLLSFQNSILGISSENEVSHLGNVSTEDILDEDRKTQSDRAPNVAVNLKAEEDKDAKAGNRIIPVVSYPPKAPEASKLDEKTLSLSELGIDKSIFIKPKTFHLTVLMLKLYNKDLVAAAANVLQSLSSKVMDALNGQPVAVRLKGLECMRGSLAKARVLYAPVEVIGGEDRLLRACQVIIDAFTEAGLVLEKDARHKLKLHATLMNARHRKRMFRKRMTRNVDTFDARGIFEQYGSEEWGEYPIREANLSQRFVFDESGYYRCLASIPFPQKCE